MTESSHAYRLPSWSTALERFYELAPYFPRCSTTKNAALTRPKELAVRHPYIQVNPKCLVSWLIFDLDDVEDWYSWETADLPPPNLVVRNRQGAHRSEHWYYAITPVAKGPNAREKPLAFLKAVYQGMAAKIRYADPRYANGPVAKTPGHRFWSTLEIHDHEYSLGELAEYLAMGDSVSPPLPGEHQDAEIESRHVWMFNHLRRRVAYPNVVRFRENDDYEGFERLLLSEAGRANQFAQSGWGRSNLRLSQLKATCRSIARWTWYRYTGRGSGCTRGVMRLSGSLPLRERQQLSSNRTHEVRRQSTKDRIVASVKALKLAGEVVTFAAIARNSGLCRQTVARYRDLVDQCCSAPGSNAQVCVNAGSERKDAVRSGCVTFGVNQITSCSKTSGQYSYDTNNVAFSPGAGVSNHHKSITGRVDEVPGWGKILYLDG